MAALLLVLPSLASAQPVADGFRDPRVETLVWREGSVLPLRTTVGGNVTLLFAPGETVQSIVVADPGAVDVQVPPQADSVLVRAIRQPVDPIFDVFTGARHYRFRLVIGPASDVVYLARLVDASNSPAPPTAISANLEGPFTYKLKGEQSLRPHRISDDGQRTFIHWLPDQPLPAVFAVNGLGEEETVDSYMRGDVLVIDRVYKKLLFRIGKRKAEALRLDSAKRQKP
ncbi:MAG: TrbG/VirB9 family P-type conjugative transfer protein [Novosphingobium sp.]|uniref:TrbG/VirB9 family P-type conjugative transfer protein n=1 Tax=Novosphingobium sp. TaxID=1874826 RepID=UPI0032BEF0BF